MSTIETENLCGLKREDFQTTINGKNTDLYVLKNKLGFEVAFTNYGGAIVAIMVPDKDGNVANVIQGHDNIQESTARSLTSAHLLAVMATESRKVSSNSTANNTSWPSTTAPTPFTADLRDFMPVCGTLCTSTTRQPC